MTNKWLTRQEASKYMKVAPRTLDRWVAEGRVTRYHIDGIRSVRFHQDDLDAMHKPEPAVAA